MTGSIQVYGVGIEAVLLIAWSTVVLLILSGAIVPLIVVTGEEHLEHLFGAAYHEYCQQVPGYLLSF